MTLSDIDKIKKWLAVSGMEKSRLGLLACANPRAIDRIENGTARISTLRQVADYIATHPPAKKASPKKSARKTAR